MLIKFCLRTNYASRQGYPQWMRQQKTGQGQLCPWQATGSSLWMSLHNGMLCTYSCESKEESSSIHVSSCLEFPVPVLAILKICEYISMCPLLLPPCTVVGQGGTNQMAVHPGISPCCGAQDQSTGKVTSSSHLTDPFQPYQFCGYHLVLCRLGSRKDQTLSLQVYR